MTNESPERPAAAIDLGTNSALLLIGRLDAHGELCVLHDECRTPRLGEGVAQSDELQEAAMQRGLEVLAAFARTLREQGVPAERCRIFGTAVLRRARNSALFLERARAELGLEVEVLPAEEEARLGYAAAVGQGADARTLVVDVGGGSTELVWGRGSRRASVALGAVLLGEHHAPDFAARKRYAQEAFLAFPADVGRDAPTVLLGGTASNLACLEQDLARFDPQAAEGASVAAQAAWRWAERLAALAQEARKELPIEPERAGILPWGMLCLGAAMGRIGVTQAWVSGRGLRYGILLESLSR